jgi:serine protease Do
MHLRDTFVVLTDGGGHGSGVYLGNGVVLTSEHVVSDRQLVVLTADGIEYEILDVLCPEDDEDIAFVLIDPNCGLTPVVLGEMPELTDPVFTVGTPLDLIFFNNVTSGIVGKLHVDWDRWDDGIMTSTPAMPGNSGGALLNKRFELIGITVGCHNRKYDGGDSLWLSEPITDILRCLELSGLDIKEKTSGS